jgi:methionyl-tRNA formyltransferase
MTSPFHIIFAGTPAFAVPSLTAIAADPTFSVDLVITQTDKPVGRNKTITPPPVKIAAQTLGIPLLQPENINDFAHHSSLIAHRCDILVVVAYGQILSKEILSLPRIAPVNLHASLLPRWRGASPIQHAILAGDTETGVTVQRMVEELDAGPIYARTETPIADRETFQTLHDRLAALGATLLVSTLKDLSEPQPQPSSGVTLCRKLTRGDGIVDPHTMTADAIDRRVRALVPWPGVRMTIGNEEVKILQTDSTKCGDALAVPCSAGTTLYVVRLQKTGGKPIHGHEWMRGHGER